MADIDEIIKKMRLQLLPTDKSPLPDRFVDELSQYLGKKAEIMIGGSWAKDTYLPGDHDIDVFVRFYPGLSDEEMSAELERALNKMGKPRRIRGSRDYFQLDREGFTFEIVPVLLLSDPAKAKNVTDMSPLHVQYVLERTQHNPSLSDEIRLAKRFLKAARVYGAESYIHGFSGHVVDQLVLYYGSFIKCLQAVSSWKTDVFIDPTNTHKNAKFLNAAKREGPLVIVDPVQPHRNAAAAVKQNAFDQLIDAARAFLKEPDRSFFDVVVLSKNAVKEQFSDKPVLFVELLPVFGNSKDIIGTKLFKVYESLVKRASSSGFEILAHDFQFDGKRALAYLVVEQEPLSEEHVVVGPPESALHHARAFRESHQNVFSEGAKLFAREKRSVRTLKQLFENLLESPSIKEKHAGAKIL